MAKSNDKISNLDNIPLVKTKKGVQNLELGLHLTQQGQGP